MKTELTILEMAALSDQQWDALRQSTVTERQEVLGKSFLESIEDWKRADQDQVLGLCFLIDDMPVGLVLFNRSGQNDPDIISIHGLKITVAWQRQGYGHAGFRDAIAYVKGKWPDARRLRLAVDAENQPAVAIYRGFGMDDSGPIFDGPNGKEHHMEISLWP